MSALDNLRQRAAALAAPRVTKRCGYLQSRRHKWGSYRDGQGVYTSVCCERCGLWWGDFVRRFPHLKDELEKRP